MPIGPASRAARDTKAQAFENRRRRLGNYNDLDVVVRNEE